MGEEGCGCVFFVAIGIAVLTILITIGITESLISGLIAGVVAFVIWCIIGGLIEKIKQDKWEQLDSEMRWRKMDRIVSLRAKGANCSNCTNHSSNCHGLPDPCSLYDGPYDV